MTKDDKKFLDNWIRDGLKELDRKSRLPKTTKAQRDAWSKLIKRGA
jgi:hypothetical protein